MKERKFLRMKAKENVTVPNTVLCITTQCTVLTAGTNVENVFEFKNKKLGFLQYSVPENSI